MNVRDLIQMHEGRVAHAYQDSLGLWTIGVGHMVDVRKGGGLPDEIIDALLDWDIKHHIDDLHKSLPWAASLDPVRHAVLVDMHFNLGSNLLGFKNTLALIQAKDYAKAADNMMQSKWAQQVGLRAVRLSKMMRTGEWP